MIRVKDIDSISAMRILSDLLGRKVGPSTGTNFIAMLELAKDLKEKNIHGSILSLLCDSGDRYLNNYHNPDWIQENFGDCTAATKYLYQLMEVN